MAGRCHEISTVVHDITLVPNVSLQSRRGHPEADTTMDDEVQSRPSAA